MDTNFNTRLKKYLLNIIRREKNRDAWDQLKTLHPNCDDLDDVILYSPFYEEAWQLFKLQNGGSEDYVYIARCCENMAIQKEATKIALERFSLDNESLEALVESTQNEEAATKLLAQNPTKEQLLSIVEHSNLCDQAAKELLQNELELDELKTIIQYSNLKNEAWQKYIQLSPNAEEIIEIIDYTDLEDVAWEYFLQQNPTNEEMEELVNDYTNTGRKRIEAAQYILNNDPDADDLSTLVFRKVCEDEAWEALIKRDLDSRDLGDIVWALIRRKSHKKDEASKLCLQYSLEKDRLWHIFNYTSSKIEAAQQLIQSSLTLHELADLVLEAPIQPVLDKLSNAVDFDYTLVNETQLIQKIAKKIVENPDLLDVNNWHNEDKHSLGGWAITLYLDAQRVEKQYSSEIAASLLLPNYTHLFFADKTTVITALEKIYSS